MMTTRTTTISSVSSSSPTGNPGPWRSASFDWGGGKADEQRSRSVSAAETSAACSSTKRGVERCEAKLPRRDRQGARRVLAPAPRRPFAKPDPRVAGCRTAGVALAQATTPFWGTRPLSRAGGVVVWWGPATAPGLPTWPSLEPPSQCSVAGMRGLAGFAFPRRSLPRRPALASLHRMSPVPFPRAVWQALQEEATARDWCRRTHRLYVV